MSTDEDQWPTSLPAPDPYPAKIPDPEPEDAGPDSVLGKAPSTASPAAPSTQPGSTTPPRQEPVFRGGAWQMGAESEAPGAPRPSAPPQVREGFVFTRALSGALRRLPLWGLTWLALWTMSLVIALPWFEVLDDAMRGRYQAADQVHHFDAIFRADHQDLLGRLNHASSRVGALLALLATLLVGVFAAGGWLQVLLHQSEGPSLRRFLRGGARHFWRFTRVLVLVLLGLSILRWTLYEMPWKYLVLGKLLRVPEADWGRLETMDSELHALQVGWAQDGLFALGFALILIWAVYTRTRLALFGRFSALSAGWSTFWSILFHPLKTLRPMLGIFLVEALFLAALGIASGWFDQGLLEQPTLGRIAVLHLVGQLGLMVRQITRGASYHAAVEVCRGLYPPAEHSDPWKTIGGPGGPQYPVDDDDEYGVAL